MRKVSGNVSICVPAAPATRAAAVVVKGMLLALETCANAVGDSFMAVRVGELGWLLSRLPLEFPRLARLLRFGIQARI